MRSVEAHDLVEHNLGSHLNHATWIRDARQPSCTPDTDNAEVRIRLKVRDSPTIKETFKKR